MNNEFITILKKLIHEHSREVLLTSARCKALLADYTGGMYKKESRQLLTAIDAGVSMAIDKAENLDICKTQQVKLLQDEYTMADDGAEEIVDVLALILRGFEIKKKRQNNEIQNIEYNKNTIPTNNVGYITSNNYNDYQINYGNKKNKSNWLVVTTLIFVFIFFIFTIFIIFKNVIKLENNQDENITNDESMIDITQQTTTINTTGNSSNKITSSTQTAITPANNMVLINGGTFIMGGDSNTRRQVTISSFYMSKYEVTQKEYQNIMGTNPSRIKGDYHPVEMVNWFEAVEYCNKISQRENLTPVYKITDRTPARGYHITAAIVKRNHGANGYRLPTEAEWEYACRAGTTTAYNTGVNISNNTGWYKANSNDSTKPVGQKPENAWGLFDMYGNVWEWCWDWYDNYPSVAQDNPVGPESSPKHYRVQRGGSYDSPPAFVLSEKRGYNPMTHQSPGLGFRVVRN